MLRLQGKNLSAYKLDGDLGLLEETLKDYRENAVSFETHAINDLEKHLWLANGAAITVSLGFIQAKGVVSQLQVCGVWTFLAAIIMLVILKFVSSINGSRDRRRYQEAHVKFYSEEETDIVFSKVRDWVFNTLKAVYLITQYGSGLLFIAGCILMVQGVLNAL